MPDTWTCRSQKEALGELLKRQSNTAVSSVTDEPFYNGTYPVLIAAGSAIMGGHSKPENTAILALGIAGWNRGSGGKKRYRYLSPTQAQWSTNQGTPDALLELRRRLIELKGEVQPPGSNQEIVDVALLAKRLLGSNSADREGLASIAEASKVVHFLAPQHFPILDSKVAMAIKLGDVTTTKNASIKAYVQYTRALWELGFFGNRHFEDPLLDRYRVVGASDTPSVSALRVVDCTLFG